MDQKIKIIGIVVLVLIVFAVVLLTNTLSGVYTELTTPAENFLDAVSSGDIDGAYGMTSSEFQDATTKIAFRVFANNLQLEDYESASWTGFEKSTNSNYGELGELTGTVTYGSGVTKSVTVQLVPEDGVWKIQYIGIN